MTFSDVTALLSKALSVGGTITILFGLVNISQAIKDHEGSKQQSAIWTIVSGGVLIAAAVLASTITF